METEEHKSYPFIAMLNVVPRVYAHRSTDLLALPTCDPDKAFGMQISHEENLIQGPLAFVQCALLYTNSNGERRIRWGCARTPVSVSVNGHGC